MPATVIPVSPTTLTPEVLYPKFRSHCEVAFSLRMVAKRLVGSSDAHQQRAHELVCSLIEAAMLERNHVPAQSRMRVGFEVGDVVGRDTRIVIIGGGLPGLAKEGAGIINSTLELSLSTCDAQLRRSTAEIH